MSKKKIIIAVCGLVIVLGAGIFFHLRMNLAEETFVTEIGSSLEQDVDVYARGYTAGATVDLSKVNTEKTGIYEASVTGKFQTLKFNIEVKDTIAPTAEVLQNQTFLTNESIFANDLVSNISDASSVTVTFENGLDSLMLTEGGDYTETVLLTDSYGNQSSLTVEFTVIADTTKPVLKGIMDITIYEGDTIAYLNNVTVTDDRDGDLTEAVKVDSTSVKTDTPGSYEVIYSVSDTAGNEATEKAQVIVKEDKAPTLSGISDKTIYVGVSVNYLDGVTATDDRDGDLTSAIKVDSSGVNTSKKGSYDVTYSVTDSFGNKTKKTAIVNVKVKTSSSSSTSKKDSSSSESSSDKGSSSSSSSGFQFFDVEPEGEQPNGDVPASGEHVGSWG